MKKLKLGLLPYFFIILFIFIFYTYPGYALVTRSGDSVTIGSEEIIDEDLYLSGGTVIINGTVNGDVWIAGRSVIIKGRIGNGVFAAGRELTILGDVGGGIKAAGETLIIGGNVGKDLMLAGNKITIEKKASIGGDFFFGAKEASIEGNLEGNIIGGSRNITITNGIMGNVKLYTKFLTLTQTAKIKGDLTYISENEANVQSGAQVGGVTLRHIPEFREKIKKVFPFFFFLGIVGKLVSFFMALIVGLIIILLIPERLQLMADSIQKKPGLSAGWGALALFATPIGITVAFATLVGIPLSVIVLFLYLISIYISQIPVSLFVGRSILPQSKDRVSKAFLFGAFVLGLFILSLLSFIPIFGYIVSLAIILFGFGAMVVSEITRRTQAQKASLT